MGFWGDLMAKFRAAAAAFKRSGLSSDPYLEFDDFDKWENRLTRYALLWAFRENTQYQEDTHTFARALKVQNGLYRYIRSVLSPVYRSGEFWSAHIWGGQIELRQENSAIPIVVEEENELLFLAIKQIYKWSNWQTKKDIVPLYGATMGDVGIKIVDDTALKKVYFEIIHPGAIKEIKRDVMGNIKAYIIEEERIDPDDSSDTVKFTEVVRRDNDSVIFETFVDDKPFAWNGQNSFTSVPYGFVPLVLIQHTDVGKLFGEAEMHTAISTINELNDLSSMVGDFIRKNVSPKWLFTGMTEPEIIPDFTRTKPLAGTTLSTDPFQGQRETEALYAIDTKAGAIPLVSDLSIEDTLKQIDKLEGALERDFPELQLDNILGGTGEQSGRALIVARQTIEVKVKKRRAGYDLALEAATKMAISIAGFRKYEGFPYDLNSFKNGDLDFTIGPRPVFGKDPISEAELKLIRANAAKVEIEAAMWPTITRWRKVLELQDLTSDEINDMIDVAIADSEREDTLLSGQETGETEITQ